jgi:3-hydroxyacyl-[acyl-carrier-protein] dehydratase
VRFLFFDRVLELETGRRILARKALGLDAELFQDHYPRRPVVPSTLIAESIAQVAGWLNFVTHDRRIRMVVALAEDLRLERPVLPGEVLDIEAFLLYRNSGGATLRAEVRIGEERVGSIGRLVFVNQELDAAALSAPEREHYAYLERVTAPGGGVP